MSTAENGCKYQGGQLLCASYPPLLLPGKSFFSLVTSVRNPFSKPKRGDFTLPGIGEVQIGINELQHSGVLFCVCDMAINVYSTIAAESIKKDSAVVKKDWLSGLLPVIQVVPSGVWAVGRAQEHGCTYCFAG